MTEMRTQRAVSRDGTEIAGRVHGDGPALVLIHGGFGDGEVAWEALWPHLATTFTCYLPSTRGRGLSADNPDHSPPRLVEDVTAFVDSIGEPVGLIGWSGSGPWVLDAAIHSAYVASVALYEPFVISVMGEEDLGRTLSTMAQIGSATADGRFLAALRAFTLWICTDKEITALEEIDFYDRWGGGLPAMLRFVQQDASYAGVRATDPEQLAQITVPMLLLRGEQSRLGTFFADSAQFIARHTHGAQVSEMPGVGHFAPLLHPESIADELITFFESVRQPA